MGRFTEVHGLEPDEPHSDERDRQPSAGGRLDAAALHAV